MGLVGNKYDLFANQQISEDEAKRFADSIGAEFEVVSAKNGDGIIEFFTNLIEKYDKNVMSKGLAPKNKDDQPVNIQLNTNPNQNNDEVLVEKKNGCCK